MRPRVSLPVLVLGLALVAGDVAGQTDGQTDEAKALALFHDGRALMTAAETLDEACTKLQESLALHDRGDTLLNLAECHRRQGKTATAWREFDKAIRVATEVEFSEAIEVAVKLRDQLAAELSELTIAVAPAIAAEPGLVVRLDGQPLAPNQWGKPMVIDPGPHRVDAELAGHVSFSQTVDVGAKSDRREVTVALARVPKPPPPPPPEKPPPRPVPPSTPSSAAVPVWIWITGGVGLALMGAAVPFGIDARDAGEDLDAECGADRLACPAPYDHESDRARELRSFGLFVGFGSAGIIALGASIVGIAIHAASAPDTEIALSVSPWISSESIGVGLTLR